jgi:hypothetical protein
MDIGYETVVIWVDWPKAPAYYTIFWKLPLEALVLTLIRSLSRLFVMHHHHNPRKDEWKLL